MLFDQPARLHMVPDEAVAIDPARQTVDTAVVVGVRVKIDL